MDFRLEVLTSQRPTVLTQSWSHSDPSPVIDQLSPDHISYLCSMVHLLKEQYVIMFFVFFFTLNNNLKIVAAGSHRADTAPPAGWV